MMGMLLVFLLLLLSFAAVTVVLLLSKKVRNTEEAADNGDLTEWVCPDCGFTVQAGDTCIYCYAKRPKPASLNEDGPA